MDARQNLLPVAVEHATAMNFYPPELAPTCRGKDPVAVMQVQYRGSKNDRMGFFRLALECGGNKHPHSQNAGIRHLDTHLGGTNIGIEHRTDVADVAAQHSAGVGIDPYIRMLAQLQFRNVVLVHIANDPDYR